VRLALLLALVAGTLALTAARAEAGTSYCSPTGDYCTSVARLGGVRYLRLSTFSFTGPIKICVRDPTNARVCRSFRLRKAGSLYSVKVLWKRHYPNRGAGRYYVSFFLGSTRLGPVLSFKQP
jgi:hypothetical protein